MVTRGVYRVGFININDMNNNKGEYGIYEFEHAASSMLK